MNRPYRNQAMAILLATLLALPPAAGFAQVPVDDDGKPLGNWSPAGESQVPATGAENIPLLNEAELQELVGPIALYPDDLLAVVLPAAAYPLQIVEAGRFLEALEADPSLQPDSEWDDSVVALLNYPEVVELLNEDIDWTWRLGEAVVAQQEDVVGAIEAFRDRAYAAGNLKSDDYQNVERENGVIEITPVADDVIYVPYYEPERVVVYQPRPVYYYYPRAYPVYYYPYPSHYYFDRGFFWGVTTAFTIGWFSDSLHIYHHSYHGHPYYGHHYYDNWWYRRPSIYTYNATYVNRSSVTINHYYQGDRWHPRHNRHDYVRNDYHDYRGNRDRYRHERETRNQYYDGSSASNGNARTQTTRREQPIRFRDRPETHQRNDGATAATTTQAARRDQPVRFRDRPETRQRNDGATAATTTRQDRRETRSQSERRDTAETAQRTDSTGNDRDRRASERREQPEATRQQPGTRQESRDTPRRAEPRERRQEPITFARRDNTSGERVETARRETRPQTSQSTARHDVRQTQRGNVERTAVTPRSESRPVQNSARHDVRQVQRSTVERATPTRRSEPQPVQRETRQSVQRDTRQRVEAPRNTGSNRESSAPQRRAESRAESRGRSSREDGAERKTRKR